MKKIGKYIVDRYLLKGLGGMAQGLFCTLIIGLILKQIGQGLGETQVGVYLVLFGQLATVLTGVGIGVGVAHALDAPKLVMYASALNGWIGAYAVACISGSIISEGTIQITGPGDPLGAFVATVVGVEIGRWIVGKTPIDILVTPIVTILSGASIGLLLGPTLSNGMQYLGGCIQAATMIKPLGMGIIVAVCMGMCLTLPISSAAIAMILGLSGLAAGAATAGCCAQMVGFAVMSYKENKLNGLLAQGLGTSMLQVPNIIRNPKIWIPPTIASAIVGPIATVVFQLENGPAGAGMGTAGLVGPILTWQTMIGHTNPLILLGEILLVFIVLPALISHVVGNWFRKKGWIAEGDLKLDV